jgi:AbrB family looped-hinge helix DNA binding protein
MAETKTVETVVRPTEDGAITIPAEIRRELGIDAGSPLRVSLVDGEIRIRRVAPDAGSPWLRELYDYFAPVRQEILDRGLTEEEVNAAIDEAVAEVRRERA